MFEISTKPSERGRGRRGVSAILSLGVFGGLAIAGGAPSPPPSQPCPAGARAAGVVRRPATIQPPKPKTRRSQASKKNLASSLPSSIQKIPTARPDETRAIAMAGRHRGRRLIEKSRPPCAAAPAPRNPSRTGAAAAQQERETIERRASSPAPAPDVPNALLSNAARFASSRDDDDDALQVVSARS